MAVCSGQPPYPASSHCICFLSTGCGLVAAGEPAFWQSECENLGSDFGHHSHWVSAISSAVLSDSRLHMAAAYFTRHLLGPLIPLHPEFDMIKKLHQKLTGWFKKKKPERVCLQVLPRVVDTALERDVASDETQRQDTPTQTGGHIEHRETIFLRATESTPLSERTESWVRRGRGFVATTRQAKVVTAGGMIESPNKLRGICSVCGQADSKFYTCASTGMPLCQKCVRMWMHPDGPVPLSPQIYVQITRRFNTWDEADYRAGRRPDFAARKLFPFYRA